MAIIISHRKHVKHHASASVLLFLGLFGLTSGFQQSSPITAAYSSCYSRRLISFQQQLTCLSSASAADVVDQRSDLLTEKDDQMTSQTITYDWDEQFEELQSFMSEYGHCNFPQNPTKPLEKKYPMLKRFCHDQRIEYKQLQIRKHGGYKLQSLAIFDRSIRCRVLEELGFEFNQQVAQWYDHYHELIQYSRENGHIRVTARDNEFLAEWVYKQRSRRRGIKGASLIAESQIKLLDDIGFEWSDIYDYQWNATYTELVAFRNEHGHFMMEIYHPLYRWMDHQRRRRAGKQGTAALTDEQIRLLDEIEFPWKAERLDAKWYAMYEEMQRFHKKHGHCQPSRSMHTKLYKWSEFQQSKHQKGSLSTEQIKLLDKIDFPLERNRREWPKMLDELTEYFNTHGHLQVNQDDDPDLYEWMSTLRERYHGTEKQTLSDIQIEQLEEIPFCWSLDWRERTWHDKYTEAVEFFKQHGHVMVTEKENSSLYNWIQMQGKRYMEVKGQKPLSEEELELLEQLDFPFFDGRPRMAWDAMYAKVARYREKNDGRFPTSHKDDPDLSRWMRQQRHRYRNAYGYAPLSDDQKSLLDSIDVPLYPKGNWLRYWYEKYDELVDFWKHNGHFLVDRDQDDALFYWVKDQRMRFDGLKRKPRSKSQVYLLERIGFTWASNRNEIEWQWIYEEVVEFLETQGHFPTRSDNPKLHRWMHSQRIRRKPHIKHTSTQLSENQIRQLDKIGFRW